MAWDDVKRAAVIEEYQDTMANEYATDQERAAATIEVVKELADKYEETVNGVRNTLSRAGVYIKKGTAVTESKTSTTTKRISKADALQELKNVIAAIDPALVDADIIDKLTGKEAAYFVSVLTAVNKD
jgi:hypothetical protein